MINIKLKYHDGMIEIPTPPGRCIGTLEGREIQSIKNPKEAILMALDNPIESPPLRNMIPKDGRITIMVSDRTRNTRLDIVLPVILKYLNDHGVTQERIHILICLGTHKSHTQENIVKLLGEDVCSKFSYCESKHEQDEEYVYVGTTPRGTPVHFRREAVESKLLIATGGITFHYFAGFSGGRKGFLPGCSSFRTIQHNHKMTYMTNPDGELVRNPSCESGRLDCNPLSEDMIDAFRLMPVPSFLVNVVLNPKSEIALVFAGDVVKAHRAGCTEFKKLYILPIVEQADLVIASPGGYPLDINLLQSHKSMVNASRAVKTGGKLLVAANCVEGVNLDRYPDFVKEHGHEELVRELQRNYEILGGTTDNLMTMADKIKIYLVSSLPIEYVKILGMIPVDPSKNDWDKVFMDIGDSSTFYVMQSASKFMPVVEQSGR